MCVSSRSSRFLSLSLSLFPFFSHSDCSKSGQTDSLDLVASKFTQARTKESFYGPVLVPVQVVVVVVVLVVVVLVDAEFDLEFDAAIASSSPVENLHDVSS